MGESLCAKTIASAVLPADSLRSIGTLQPFRGKDEALRCVSGRPNTNSRLLSHWAFNCGTGLVTALLVGFANVALVSLICHLGFWMSLRVNV